MRAAIIGCLLVIFVAGYHYQQERPQATNVENARDNTPPKAIPAETQVTAKRQQQQAYQKARGYLRTAFGPEYLAAWVLVLAAVIGLYVTWRTARAAFLNAEAALLSATAMVHAERPWLFVPIGEKFAEIGHPFLVERLPGTFQYSSVAFRLKNFGRSPARVIKWKLHLVIRKDADCPGVQEFGEEGAVPADFTLPQGETAPLQASIWPDGKVTMEEKNCVLAGTMFLWLCGYIQYIDTFDRRDRPTYETRLCYRWMHGPFLEEQPFWRMEGPLEHNRAK